MKKLILTSACALAMCVASQAQGLVNWGSISFANFTAQTNATTGSFVSGGGATGSGTVGSMAPNAPGQFYFAFLYNTYSGSQAAQPSSISALDSWTYTGLTATNNTAAGRVTVVNANQGAAVTGFTPGVTNSIMMVGWSANLGTTWAAALNVLNNWSTQGSAIVGNAFFGTSNTGYITTVDTVTVPGVNVFGSTASANGLPIQSLNTQLYLLTPAAPVPEPSTLVLAGLGGLSLLAFRRKK